MGIANKPDTKVFSSDEMQNYLEDFDVIGQKYFYWLDKQTVDKSELDDLKDRIFRRWHQNDMIDRYSVENAIDTYQTLEKVYGKKYRGDENYLKVGLPNLVTERFLKHYVNIPGADKLFSSKYFGFEWGMHLEYKEKKKDYSYYRDHYIHQIRNMYEMFIMLDDLKFRDLCKIVYSQNNSVIGECIWHSIDEEIRGLRLEDESIFQDIYKIYEKSVNGKLKLGELQREIYFHEIICSASVLAALVHDIGYPVTYMSRVADELQDFVPIIRDFMDIKMNIPHIYAELEQSVLFRFFSHELIEKKLKDRDHGAVSAVILLKYYYNKGFIRQFSPVKRMVIELAAVVIFSHTLKYKIHDEKEYDEIRPMFYENPLSFLFRLCDDMQEWDREYFEISFKHNYFICEKCHTMHYYDKKEKKYYCCCNTSRGINLTGFLYRRLVQVNTSDEVVMQYSYGESNDTIGNMGIHIKYDLFKLLLMSNYNSNFAKIRAEEIRKIKRELANQRNFPQTFIDSVITANPIILKIKIIEKFDDNSYNINLNRMDYRDLDALFDCFKKENDFYGEVEKFVNKNKITCTKLKQRTETDTVIVGLESALMTDKLKFYVRMMFAGKIIRTYGRSIKINGKALNVDDLYELFLKMASDDLFAEWDLSDPALQYLCADYLWQCRNELSPKQFFDDSEIDSYYDLYIQTDFIGDEVRAYTNESKYGEIVRKCNSNKLYSPIPIDFFSDLYMFYEMNEYIKQMDEDHKKSGGI